MNSTVSTTSSWLYSTFPLYKQEAWTPDVEVPLLFLSVVFTLIVHAWETYLDYRQHVRVAKTGATVPTELKTLVTRIEATQSTGTDTVQLLQKLEEKAPKAQAYALSKSKFKFVSATFGLLQTLTLALLGAQPYAWDVATSLTSRFSHSNEIVISLVYAGMWVVFETIIQLPFEIYSTFVIEQKHGFNSTTFSLFVSDKIKTLVLTALLGSPVLAMLLNIMRWAGAERLALYAGVFLFVVSLFFLTIFPIFIQPLFNKYEPLEQGTLRKAIEDLAISVKYPLYKLFTVDGSKRSAHSNAYMYGFSKSKRIVLYDTLLKQADTEEIVAILAHELGHWKFGHTLLNFAVTQTYFFCAFLAFSKAMGWPTLYAAFGFTTAAQNDTTCGAPIVVGLILFFNTLWEPVDHVLNFVLTLNSRRMEYQADNFAVTLDKADALQRGLVKITFENLGVLDPDPWYSTYHHSHPPLVHRLRAIDADDKKAK